MKHRKVFTSVSVFLVICTALLSLGASAVLADSAPSNDNFADAIIVDNLPFVDSPNMEYATTELDEPRPNCGAYGDFTRTVWYAYTPDNPITITANYEVYGSGAMAVYERNGLGDLRLISCQYSSQIVMQMEAGTPYYFQVDFAGPWWGDAWSTTFRLERAAPPNINVYITPSDPSKYNVVEFYNYSNDPAGMSLSSQWDLGDGTTSNEWGLNHQYSRDGDYTVKLEVTAPDGRSSAYDQVVHVRTHDVVISRFDVPQSARAGQTRQITVYVSNKVYDETVQVLLYKSTPGGEISVGNLTLYVPSRPNNRMVAFAFSYTFTPEDAAMGKVTFRAVANIQNARDALPADNQAVALPAKVTK